MHFIKIGVEGFEVLFVFDFPVNFSDKLRNLMFQVMPGLRMQEGGEVFFKMRQDFVFMQEVKRGIGQFFGLVVHLALERFIPEVYNFLLFGKGLFSEYKRLGFEIFFAFEDFAEAGFLDASSQEYNITGQDKQ